MSGASGTESNTIIQEFEIEKDKEYIVSFDIAGNTDCASNPPTKTLQVRIGFEHTPEDPNWRNFTFDIAGKDKKKYMAWRNESFTFTAAAVKNCCPPLE